MKSILFFAFFLASFIFGFITLLTLQHSPPPKQTTKPYHKKTIAYKKSVKAATTMEEIPVKNEFTFAVYGDSMEDTMGEGVDYLQAALEKKYPKIVFHLYNYGIGGENVQKGLDRFALPFHYQLRNYPPITSIHPDAVVLGSFAYNPFSPYDRNKHWITYSQLVEKTETITPHVFILAEIAPLGKNFGKGPHGVNWPAAMTETQSKEITELLENVIALGTALHVPVINAYELTKSSTETGTDIYTNSDDGIHPSIAGHTFLANLIARSFDTIITKPIISPTVTPLPRHEDMR